MRFRTRAFLICFIPFAILLTASFWMIQRFVQSTVRDGLRTSLRQNQLAIAGVHSKSDLQNSRFLKVVGENAALKGGLQLLISGASGEAAVSTVQDQLRELGEHMGFDFLLVSAPNGRSLAGVIREPKPGGELLPADEASLTPNQNGLVLIDGRPFQIASLPLDQNDENIGSLSVGEYFDFSEFTTPAVLIRSGEVIQSNLPNVSLVEIEKSLRNCAGPSECDIHLQGADWISLPMPSDSFGDSYVLRTLENVDSAIAPVETILHKLFLTVALCSVIVAFLCSVASSRSTVKPIAAMVSHLRRSTHTGILQEFDGRISSIVEICELVDNYNRAAVSVHDAHENLHSAYVEFVGSLANALDARDRYTSGHSRRVSQLSAATAAAMQLDADHVERIRIGALLHDIGKIGIADDVLQKPGRLTDEEFALVKEHPVIGRRILEGVQGLAPFLDAVEFHHENWDGTGYPQGQAGEETLIDARIIHVADAYDAMTTDRSYRRGMPHERALKILGENAGTQFDPDIVELFTMLPADIMIDRSDSPETLQVPKFHEVAR